MKNSAYSPGMITYGQQHWLVRQIPWNYNKDGQLFMAGFDYSPTRGVKIAPTFPGMVAL